MKHLLYLLIISSLLLLACKDSATNHEADPTTKNKPINIGKEKAKDLSALKKELSQWHSSDSKKGLEVALQHIGHDNQSIRNAARMILENKDWKDWLPAIQKASSFNEETTLLAALINVDTLNEHAQMISNRLQTFDLKHLNDKEQLAIIRLYESSLAHNEKPSENILQSAYAKLKGNYPTDNELVNKELSKVLSVLRMRLKEN